MKSLITQTIYAGLGLLSEGTDAIKNLGQELARKADVSEVEGEKMARKLHAKSGKAVKSIRKTLDAEVTKVADAIHAAIRGEVKTKKSKPASAAKTSSRKGAKTTRTGGKVVRVR